MHATIDPPIVVSSLTSTGYANRLAVLKVNVLRGKIDASAAVTFAFQNDDEELSRGIFAGVSSSDANLDDDAAILAWIARKLGLLVASSVLEPAPERTEAVEEEPAEGTAP